MDMSASDSLYWAFQSDYGPSADLASDRLYAEFQASNPEDDFNEELIRWRTKDDIGEYLDDIFRALEVVPGITYQGLTVIKDESKFPRELSFNDIEVNRLDLARVRFYLEAQGQGEEVELSIFLPKLVDDLFYVLNGNTYYPILQIVDRTVYTTSSTYTLKTLLMPIIFRRGIEVDMCDVLADEAPGEHPSMVFTIDLFKYKINVLTYVLASKGLQGTSEFFGMAEDVGLVSDQDLANVDATEWCAFRVTGPAEVHMVARRSWVAEDEPFRRSLLATMREAIASATADELVEDSILTWRRKLGSYFTKNPVAAEEKAAKILVSLERILDARTRKNLAGVEPGDKEDIYCVLRWMMREYRHLIAIDNMDIRNKRIRLAEYVLHSLLLKLSEGTYRLLNTKNLTLRGLVGVFRPFMVEERTGGASRPQVYYIIRRLIVNDLLRYANMVNSFDLLLALRWTSRGQAGIVGRGGRGEISTKFRGLHPSYIGRIGLTAASAGDPGVSGTFVPFVKTDGQFFL